MPIYFDDESIYLKHIWTPVVRGYSAIKDGILANYTSYLRLEDAYAEDATEQIIRVGRDIPPYEFVDTPEMGLERRHRQYEGTNLVPDPENPELWILTGGATYNPTTQEFTLPDAGQVQMLIEDTTSYQSAYVVSNLVVESISGTLSYSLYDGETIDVEIVSAPCDCEIEKTFSATSSSIRSYMRNASGVEVVMKVSKPQVGLKKLPYIPVGNQTVNKGLIAMPIEAIDTASFKLDPTNSDDITTPITHADMGDTISFCGTFRTCSLTSNQAVFGGVLGAFLLLRLNTNGSLQFWADATGSSAVFSGFNAVINTTYKWILSYNSIISELSLYINDSFIETKTYSPAYGTGTLTYGSWNNSVYFDCYMWDNRIYKKILTPAERTAYQNNESITGALLEFRLTKYREDTFVEDFSGNGNHGTASRNVNLLLAENQGFGYPVELEERKSFDATTDDGVDFKYGAKGVLQGIAKGVELVSSMTPALGVNLGGSNYTIDGPVFTNTVVGTNAGYPRFRWTLDIATVVGERYFITGKITGDTSSVNLVRMHPTTADVVSYNSITGVFCCYVTATGVSTTVEVSTDGTSTFSCTMESFSVRKVSPAVGHINFEEYMFAGFPGDEITNGTFDADTDWTKGTGTTISSGTANFVTADNLAIYQNIGLSASTTYLIKTAVSNYNSGKLIPWSGGHIAVPTIDMDGFDGNGIKTVMVTINNNTGTNTPNGNLIFGSVVGSEFTGSMDNVEVREVIVLVTKEDGTPLLYIDPFTGILTATDGTNICVSPSALIPLIYYSFFLYLNGNQFWITLDTTKGTEVAFTGSINDLGNRLRIMPTGTYQTVEDIIIGDSLNFYYIVQNDVYIVQNGTTIIQYS